MKDMIAEGKAEGKLEGLKLTAINMLKANMPLAQISLITGLSQDDIVKLK